MANNQIFKIFGVFLVEHPLVIHIRCGQPMVERVLTTANIWPAANKKSVQKGRSFNTLKLFKFIWQNKPLSFWQMPR